MAAATRLPRPGGGWGLAHALRRQPRCFADCKQINGISSRSVLAEYSWQTLPVTGPETNAPRLQPTDDLCLATTFPFCSFGMLCDRLEDRECTLNILCSIKAKI